jgi:hypothetical protein
VNIQVFCDVSLCNLIRVTDVSKDISVLIFRVKQLVSTKWHGVALCKNWTFSKTAAGAWYLAVSAVTRHELNNLCSVLSEHMIFPLLLQLNVLRVLPSIQNIWYKELFQSVTTHLHPAVKKAWSFKSASVTFYYGIINVPRYNIIVQLRCLLIEKGINSFFKWKVVLLHFFFVWCCEVCYVSLVLM